MTRFRAVFPTMMHPSSARAYGKIGSDVNLAWRASRRSRVPRPRARFWRPSAGATGTASNHFPGAQLGARRARALRPPTGTLRLVRLLWLPVLLIVGGCVQPDPTADVED